MSFFHALYTGTAGLMAQSQATNRVSENIANMTTVGYKRNDTAFQDLVTKSAYSSVQNGSVTGNTVQRVSQQGALQQTSSGTDLAISGNGFFVVREDNETAGAETYYTRNGTFNQDQQGFLKNSAGFTLYGWAYDRATSSFQEGTTVDSLVPIMVDSNQTSVLPTTQGEMIFNLDAAQQRYDSHTFDTPQQLPVSSQPAHFSRNLTVYDSNGTARDLVFEYRRVVGPMAHFTAGTAGLSRDDVLVDNPGGFTNAITTGDQLVLDDGTNTYTVDFVGANPNLSLNQASTLDDLINVINNFTDGTGAQVYTATLSETGRLTVQANSLNANIDISASSANVLGNSGLSFITDPDGGVGDYTYEPEADVTANGTANPNQTDFPALADTDTPNPFNWWEATVLIEDPTFDALTDTGTPALVELKKGLLNFDGLGNLNATPDANGNASITFNNINFSDFNYASDGTALAAGSDDVSFTVDIGDFTQYAGGYDVLFTDQNGAGVGTFRDIEINEEGIVYSVFTNGERLESFRIPLATFANADGLERITGTAFRASQDSGDVTLNQTRTGSAGVLQVSHVEGSNVDLSNEFSLLIVNQRAFSLNSRLINTVDEMTQTLSQLKR